MSDYISTLIQSKLTQRALPELLAVLRSARTYLARPENDFSWSSWRSQEDALVEMDSIIENILGGAIPERASVAVLFAATGPIQEVSLSSGWGQEFVDLGGAFDRIECRFWPAQPA
jgi:hypothetical protein